MGNDDTDRPCNPIPNTQRHRRASMLRTRHRQRRASERGVTLLESVMALAVGGIAIAGIAAAMETGARIIHETRSAWLALDVARNALESRIGSPCAQAYECPPDFQCELATTPLASLSVDRVGVTVTAPPSPLRIRLDTLVRQPSCATG
ncbi:MAG TPA: prepilin-type N-terminal cleavage/methylation domain-containing protein [Candidatus Limnocylindrales bacterium]|nr:prepilin-type N-terminal cleavage/methylation domain-containing protein [Candidatus Limnocylindrales bacterium]